MSILTFLVVAGALALVMLGRKLAWALWQVQVRLARLEQSLANMAAAEREIAGQENGSKRVAANS